MFFGKIYDTTISFWDYLTLTLLLFDQAWNSRLCHVQFTWNITVNINTWSSGYCTIVKFAINCCSIEILKYNLNTKLTLVYVRFGYSILNHYIKTIEEGFRIQKSTWFHLKVNFICFLRIPVWYFNSQKVFIAFLMRATTFRDFQL